MKLVPRFRWAWPLWLCGLLVLPLLGCQSEDHPGDPFPLARGSSWSYKSTTKDFRVDVVATQGVGAEQTWTLETYEEGKLTQREVYQRRGGELVVTSRTTSEKETPLDPAEVYLREPLRLGLEWEWHSANKVYPSIVRGKVEAWETVTVPAGAFGAWRVRTYTKLGGTNPTEIYGNRWFAPNVGLVKETSEGGADAAAITVNNELLAYKLAGT